METKQADDISNPEEETEGVFEPTTREEYINCACNAINAVSEFNALTKADSDRQKRIMRKCMRILDEYTSEMYDEIFEADEED